MAALAIHAFVLFIAEQGTGSWIYHTLPLY